MIRFLAWLGGVAVATALGTIAIVAVLESQIGRLIVVMAIGMM